MLNPVVTFSRRAEDDHDEHQRRWRRRRSDEQAQRADGGPAGVADDAGDGTERADRGQPHDAGQDLEHQPLQHGDEVQDRLTLAAQGLHGEADEQRDEQGLQHRAVGQRGEQGGRDDVDDEVPGATRPPGTV